MDDRQHETPGERGLLGIPIAVCGALLVVAITVMAAPPSTVDERAEVACIQAAPLKSSCP